VTGSAPLARFETKESVTSPPLIVERDDGRFQIGLDDESAAGPFETEAVRLRNTRHLPWAVRQ
jgi:hypothetical protein